MKNVLWILCSILLLLFDGPKVEAYLEEGYELQKPGTASSRRFRPIDEGEEVRITQTASRDEVEEEEEVFVINLKDVGIRFQTNRSTLDASSQRRAERIAQLLAKHPELWTRLKLEGHTDARGSAKHNMELSQKRVMTVVQLFRDNNVPESKITHVAYGETRPIDAANTPAAWEKNRRVELKLYGIEADTKLARALALLFYGRASDVPSKLITAHHTTLVQQASVDSARCCPKAPGITKTKNTFKINLYQAGIHFAFDKSTLKKPSATKIRQVGQLLKEHKAQWKTMELSGHADIRGTQAYNMELSKRRVRTVGDLLTSQGLDLQRITAKAFGPNKPLIDEMNEQAWARNRRVEILLNGISADSKLAKSLEALFEKN